MRLELKKLIYEKCLTLRQFSQASGISYKTIHALANNTRPSVKLSTIEKLCVLLECTPNDLIKLD